MTNPPIFLSEPWLTPTCATAVSEQVKSGFVGPGPTGQKFADELAGLAGAETATPMASGTVALSVAALLCGLKAGDEVALPAYGVISVINAFASLGLRPRLIDIDPATGCMSPHQLEKHITQKTRAVCFVDFCASLGPELFAIKDICKKKNIPLIEDAAWALGRVKGDVRGGGVGDVGITSFSVPKTITTGQGGAVFAPKARRDEAVAYVDQGDAEWRKTGINRAIGNNLRMSDVTAALGRAQLMELQERFARKARNHAIIKEQLGVRLFGASDGGTPAQNIVFVEDPDGFLEFLKGQGVMGMRQYKTYIHHPPFAPLAAEGPYAGAEFWTRHAAYLPFGVGMTEEQAAHVARAAAAYNGRFLEPNVVQ